MTRAFVGLGSNQAAPERRTERALAAMEQLPRSAVTAVSPRYWTPPVGDPDQPEFLNAVVELETGLEALELLRALQNIETAEGRERDQARRWGPRTIDLDLLLFGHEIIRHEELVVPHPRMSHRAFVLKPLADLAPSLEIPGHGRVDELLAAADCTGIRRARDFPHPAAGDGP